MTFSLTLASGVRLCKSSPVIAVVRSASSAIHHNKPLPIFQNGAEPVLLGVDASIMGIRQHRQFASSAAGSPMKLVVFVGSVREGRMADRVSKLVCRILDKQSSGTWQYTFMDPMKETNFGQVRKPIHFYPPGETPPQWLVAANEVVKSADAYITICGEYNREIPPALASTLDHFPPPSYTAKPCLNVCYSMGPQGGAIVANRLRSFVTELSMIPLQGNIAIPMVQKTLAEDGTSQDKSLEPRIETLLKQTRWYAQATKNQRSAHGPFPV